MEGTLPAGKIKHLHISCSHLHQLLTIQSGSQCLCVMTVRLIQKTILSTNLNRWYTCTLAPNGNAILFSKENYLTQLFKVVRFYQDCHCSV